ncbi:enolase C-terminal domain-like protein [Mycolicibacterium aichiense]|uniref:O-succinylbenzoate synthase n=1 Tax=Mycolicibacterium aichiense TaxID=1799 RepID=A0AAD1HMZ2_9MYCO|nr:enolase C-terminal domain-like protein [Mycolicibacterium aichiense]MCV7020481.1 O-succinylbenzoate synthase [Mycolicibacterium aichiense]BBX07994.1 o-succinylbenzoate synthase [Mycolicibacterium aichiense]STZ81803.1 O-succinylbenzoate-CoA synthase [Mycolicibacterium aichiense]
MKEMIDFDGAPIFAIPAREDYPGFGGCEGMLLEGPQGWGEFCPPRTGSDLMAARWLTSAIEGGTVGWPDPIRGRVPVAVAVPAVGAEEAAAIAVASGCQTADVMVTGLSDDADRLAAVRCALGPDASIRCLVDGWWDLDTAAATMPRLDTAAGGLQFVQQPCASSTELAALRRRIDVRVAVDVSDLSSDGLTLAEVADILVLDAAPLGGVRRALRFAEKCDLPVVVSGAGQTSMGLASGLALAGVLPELSFACGLGTAAALAGDIVPAGRALITADGYLPVAPSAPAPDLHRLAEFTVDDAERIAWWRERLRTARELL